MRLQAVYICSHIEKEKKAKFVARLSVRFHRRQPVLESDASRRSAGYRMAGEGFSREEEVLRT